MTAAAPVLATFLLLSATSLRASNDSFAEATDLSSETLQVSRYVPGAGTAESIEILERALNGEQLVESNVPTAGKVLANKPLSPNELRERVRYLIV